VSHNPDHGDHSTQQYLHHPEYLLGFPHLLTNKLMIICKKEKPSKETYIKRKGKPEQKLF